MTQEVPYTPVYAEELVLKNLPPKIGKLLDYGSGPATFTKFLPPKAKQVYACDIDVALVKKVKAKYKNIHFDVFDPKGKTPYKKNFFDVITMMGVLEHVADERETLVELHRILKPGGKIYIYGINKGLTGFLDSANLKFVAPRLHRFFYEIFHGKKAYRDQFVSKSGMFGDFTAGKSWHTHYSESDLKKLFRGLFVIKRTWYYSLFLPLLLVMEFVYASIFKRRNFIITKLIGLDNQTDYGKLSYCFVVEVQKK